MVDSIMGQNNKRIKLINLDKLILLKFLSVESYLFNYRFPKRRVFTEYNSI